MRTQPPQTGGPRSPLHAALLYATMGWPVLPLHHPTDRGCSCGRRRCASIGKHPRTRDGVYDATTNLDEIEQTWMRRPEANVGIATGAIVVIDVDGVDGLSAIGELERAHGKLPPTPSVATGSGIHLYFDSGAREIGNSSGDLPARIDVRGAGGRSLRLQAFTPTDGATAGNAAARSRHSRTGSPRCCSRSRNAHR